MGLLLLLFVLFFDGFFFFDEFGRLLDFGLEKQLNTVRSLFVFFKTGLLYVALAVLELTLYIRLASNSEIHLPLPPEC